MILCWIRYLFPLGWGSKKEVIRTLVSARVKSVLDLKFRDLALRTKMNKRFLFTMLRIYKLREM